MRIAQRFNAGKEVPVVPSPEGTAEWVRYRRSPRPALVKACRQECRQYGRQECLTVTRVFRPIPVGVLQHIPEGWMRIAQRFNARFNAGNDVRGTKSRKGRLNGCAIGPPFGS